MHTQSQTYVFDQLAPEVGQTERNGSLDCIDSSSINLNEVSKEGETCSNNYEKYVEGIYNNNII